MTRNLLDAIARSDDVAWLNTCLNHNIKTGSASVVEIVRQRLIHLGRQGKNETASESRIHMTAVEQALAIWPVLTQRTITAASQANAKITYGNLVVAIGYPNKSAARSIRRALGLIGWYCLKHGLPTLNSIVVNQGTTEAGESVVLHNGLTPERERANVVRFDWTDVQSPTAAALRIVADEHARRVAS
jgi:hypothetical protein